MIEKSSLNHFLRKCLRGVLAIVLASAMVAIASASPGDGREE